MISKQLEMAKAIINSEEEWMKFVYGTGEYEQLYIERVLLTNGMLAAVVESTNHGKLYTVVADFTEATETPESLSLYESRDMITELRAGKIPGSSTEQPLHQVVSVQ